MGSKEGLIDFLRYAKNNIEPKYKSYADAGKLHRVFIFVDHGGGSIGGVCLDAYAKHDININDIKTAFNSVYQNSKTNPPFEVVAFDTCLMSTYETAVDLKGTAKYMVGSQESMWGATMFEYTGLISQLSQNPAMNGVQLGKIICNTYQEDCSRVRPEYDKPDSNYLEDMTLAVIDLNQIEKVETAYENFGRVAGNYAQRNQNTFTSTFTAAANSADKFSPEVGCCMVDLKDFAQNIKTTRGLADSPELNQASDTLIAAINSAVIYQTPYQTAKNTDSVHARAGGLSTYFPFNYDNLKKYSALANNNLAPKSMANFYKSMEKNANFVTNPAANQNANTNAVQVKPGSMYDFSDFDGKIEVYVSQKEKKVSVDLSPKILEMDRLDPNIMNRISGVNCQLIRLQTVEINNEKYLAALFLGQNTDLKSDWDLGKFESNFHGDWLTIDNNPVFVQVISQATQDAEGNKSGSDFYHVPILLNGKLSTLLVTYNYSTQKFNILGAKPDTNSLVPVNEIEGLKKGDVVIPIFLALVIPVEDIENEKIQSDFQKFSEEIKAAAKDEEKLAEIIQKNPTAQKYLFRYEGDAFTIGNSVEIKNADLPNGHYAYVFEFVNPVGANNASSAIDALFTVENGKITLREGYDIKSPEDLK